MRQFVIHSLAAAAIGALLAVSSASAFAKTAASATRTMLRTRPP
jgi:hypothetical protein